jgi:uncharacterized membrane protein YgcG
MNLFHLWKNRHVRKAIRLYLVRLGPALAHKYGKEERYTPEQVETVIEEADFPAEYMRYAVAIYCQSSDFVEDVIRGGEKTTYWGTRQEIGDEFFHGNANFSPYDVVVFRELENRKLTAAGSSADGGESSVGYADNHGGGHGGGGHGH